MTVDMWCVCYECRMVYHCIIMDLESVNKHLFVYLFNNNASYQIT